MTNQSKALQMGKKSIAEIVEILTLEEKAALVVGTGMYIAGIKSVIGEAEGRVPGAAGNTMNINRVDIPRTILADGPAGVRIDPYPYNDNTKSFYATAWPVATLLASSWDINLVKAVGTAFSNEIKEYGIDIILAPGMNIQRDPLNGRNFEYYSEDPVVTGYMAAAMVKGIQANGVGTSIKHFAVNNQETNRGSVNAIVSERTLREIYLRGFEIAVKDAQPWTVMSSYNKINGSYTSESHELLTTILRKEWGFKGYVMSDWFAGKDRIAQMKAGNDLIQPGSREDIDAVIEAVNKGTLSIKVLDQNVERILSIIRKTPSFKGYKYSNSPDLKSHAALARRAAAESMVLLKNKNNTLPLTKGAKLALFGNASYETIICGTGSGQVNVAYTISISQGLTKAGYSNMALETLYATYIRQHKFDHPNRQSVSLGTLWIKPELNLDLETIEKSAQELDIAIFTIGRNAGECVDRKIDDDFNLSESEKILIKNIADAFHAQGKKLVVIMNIGGVIETAAWKDYADAILLAWQPGLEAGNAVADVLSGVVNASGKLAVTFPMKYHDVPSSKNFPGTPADDPTKVIYEEGIYIGYRYFNKFNVKPTYPFGFGLSYSEFAYGNLELSSTTFHNRIIATITITNTGKFAGKEVVQLYLSAPQNKLTKPLEELKAFAKTDLLKSGASQTLTFTLHAKDLASFYTDQSAWIADAGIYTVKIAASCEDIKATKNFTLAYELTVEKMNKVLVPQVNINELE
ncbi:MAG: beta-glucosidase [Daejeonella sp.]|nr:beta-glucosidase [Daejeonella sp.]